MRYKALYYKYVKYVHQFEDQYKRSPSGEAYDMKEFPKRFVVAPNRRFTPPNWSGIFTRRPRDMSEDEYVEAIKKQAHSDVIQGKCYSSKGHYALFQSYIQCVSPDRVAVYKESMNRTGGKMNATFKFFDEYGRIVLRWNPFMDTWEFNLTSLEKARTEIYKEVYNQMRDSSTKYNRR